MYGRTKTGQIYLTERATAFKMFLGWKAKLQNINFGKKDCRIDIVFKIRDHRKHDPDNMLKITLDSLKKVIIDDDSQFIHGSWTIEKGHTDKTIINIEEIEKG